MYGVFWHAVVKQGMKQEVLDFLRWDLDVAKESEPGTVRFDVYDDPNNLDGLFVYELYVDEDAFARHQGNEPYQRWRAEIRPNLVSEIAPLMGFSTTVLSID